MVHVSVPALIDVNVPAVALSGAERLVYEAPLSTLSTSEMTHAPPTVVLLVAVTVYVSFVPEGTNAAS